MIFTQPTLQRVERIVGADGKELPCPFDLTEIDTATGFGYQRGREMGYWTGRLNLVYVPPPVTVAFRRWPDR